MNLANLGKAGLLAAQNRLQTAGHNINNVDTAGYATDPGYADKLISIMGYFNAR